MLPSLEHKEVNLYSPLTLAFLGDAVYEQLVRTKIVLQANMPANKLHTASVKRVCCEYQSAAMNALLKSGFLTEDEQYIARRGKNANGVSPPKHSTAYEYRCATALECLFGFLFLEGKAGRLDEIFEFVWKLGENTPEIREK